MDDPSSVTAAERQSNEGGRVFNSNSVERSKLHMPMMEGRNTGRILYYMDDDLVLLTCSHRSTSPSPQPCAVCEVEQQQEDKRLKKSNSLPTNVSAG